MSTTPTRFMRIPFFVTAWEVTADNLDEIAQWCEGHVITETPQPFVRVPVVRPAHKKMTEAYPGTWVVRSTLRGEHNFKVYTTDRLRNQFAQVGDGVIIEGLDDDKVLDEAPQPQPRPPANIPVQFRPGVTPRITTL